MSNCKLVKRRLAKSRLHCGRNYTIHRNILFVQEPLAQSPYRKETSNEK